MVFGLKLFYIEKSNAIFTDPKSYNHELVSEISFWFIGFLVVVVIVSVEMSIQVEEKETMKSLKYKK